MRQWIYYGIFCLALITGVVVLLPFTTEEEGQVVNAFTSLPCEETVSTVECIAYYGKGNLTVRQKEEILLEIGESIGLHNDYTFYEEENTNGKVRVLAKQSDNYTVAIKMLTVEEEEVSHYLYVNIAIEDSASSAMYYKEKVKKAMEQFVEKPQVTVNLVGIIDGKCSDKKKEELVEQLLNETGSKLVIDGRDAGLYTVYGYTNKMEDCVTVNGEAVNINIAITYDEAANQSKIYLATPIIEVDY